MKGLLISVYIQNHQLSIWRVERGDGESVRDLIGEKKLLLGGAEFFRLITTSRGKVVPPL